MIEIRQISFADNKTIASIIKEVMMEFRADPTTTVLGDPTIHTMYENYQASNAIYYVALLNNKIVGGCGIRKLEGTRKNICELQRMFLLPDARGKKIGKQLMDLCIVAAKKFRYDKIYLESLKQMESARVLYEIQGFVSIKKPLGNTAHGGCDVWMIMNL